MATELTGRALIARLLAKLLLELSVGSIVLFIWSLFFDVGFQLTGSLGTILFGAPLLLLVAATLTFYLPFSIFAGLVFGILGGARPLGSQLSTWYPGVCILYIFIGLFTTGGELGSIAIGVSLMIGNLAFILLSLKISREP